MTTRSVNSKPHLNALAQPCTLLLAGLVGTAALTAGGTGDWKDNTIAPVANPIFFEDPQINSEVRPLFIQHNIPDNFVTHGGDVRVYALQLRYAINDRLALIATKDGFIEFNPEQGLPHKSGWADLAAGLKYAVVDDRERQLIVTPGLTFEVPTGQDKVFQANGSGEWNLFVSAGKGWDKLHATANAGFRIPNDWSEESVSMHYSLQLDYFLCRYFIPFVVMNGFTVLADGDQIGLQEEGYDLINFGASESDGWTGILVGGGIRSRLHDRVDLGFAYEKAVASPEGLFDHRFTVDLIWRF